MYKYYVYLFRRVTYISQFLYTIDKSLIKFINSLTHFNISSNQKNVNMLYTNQVFISLLIKKLTYSKFRFVYTQPFSRNAHIF